METLPLTRSERLEYKETLRVLACLMFEIQTHLLGDEDPPSNILMRLGAIIEHAPPAVLPLIEHLRHNPPEERAGEIYTYSFPFIQWQCAEHLPTWDISPLTSQEST